MTYRFTCHTDSQWTVCGIYLSHLRFSSIAIELKVDGQRALILGVTVIWRMFWKNGKRENDETFTLNAWILANTSVPDIWKYFYWGSADMTSKKSSLANFE